MGELTKTDNAGKNSPGPIYDYQDQIKYDGVSCNFNNNIFTLATLMVYGNRS